MKMNNIMPNLMDFLRVLDHFFESANAKVWLFISLVFLFGCIVGRTTVIIERARNQFYNFLEEEEPEP